MQHFLDQAAQELGGEPKALMPETVELIKRLEWRGNVRQLENAARWLTVMASGREIHVEDLPPELRQEGAAAPVGTDWRAELRRWAREQLRDTAEPLLEEALPAFEIALIETALEHTGGRRRDAALKLGWGRNTLTRKIKELGLGGVPADPEEPG
jgi:two-component system nitrogen regulation response regulator GlnG